ncbi:MAG: hypothetical protein GF411_01600 [Candidatus Lokiarchaeota archaeon]|nr:hypothetical protein [Candidatus Lokiarchaeota archaeon]
MTQGAPIEDQENSLQKFFRIAWDHFKKTSNLTKLLVFAVLITALSCVHYLFTMINWTFPGFSLDDSWIHLQYARTIYDGTPWEYSPGYPSTGSTSPLWSLVLSSLFIFTQKPIELVIGTYLISIVFYSFTTFLVGYIVNEYTGKLSYAVCGMIGFVIMPRTTWLMLSGMETPIFLFLLILGVALLDKTDIKYDPIIGVVVGLAFLSRPEGAILALFVLIRFLMLDYEELVDWKRWISLIITGALALLVVSPWIFHCLSTTGLPLPDTFYAKVHPPTEDQINAWRFWWNYWLIEYFFIMIGGILGIALVVEKKPFTWLLAVGLVLLYRLNVPYASLINNARYLVPVFSFFLITAIASIAKITPYILQYEAKLENPLDRELITLLFLIFLMIVPLLPEYVHQADFYGNSVKNINEQQVYIGYWLANNTPQDAVLAIHDAGAIRFISNRTVIDLAGLVSPDIIHGNMSTIELLYYLREQGCNYFVFFNELMLYYQILLGAGVTIKLTVHLDDNVISGRDTMSVYHVNWSKVTILDYYYP